MTKCFFVWLVFSLCEKNKGIPLVKKRRLGANQQQEAKKKETVSDK